jgi:ABC-type phosphate/phosphonate transport system substrate-binding protein
MGRVALVASAVAVAALLMACGGGEEATPTQARGDWWGRCGLCRG